MIIRPITIKEAEFIAYRAAVELLNFNEEPISPFSTRSPGRLESCLLEPFQTYGGKFLHYSFASRAATLFYLITKNHCFLNGNKRMAIMLTMTFCYVNNRWMNLEPLGLYKIAKKVAESDPKDKDEIINYITNIFGKNIIKN